MTTLNLYDAWRKFIANPARAAAASGTLKVAVVTGSYTPDQAADEFWSSVQANEVSGTGYTAGGNACASPAWSGPDGAGLLAYDAADPAAWAQTGGGFTNGRRAVLYFDTGTPSTSRLVGYSADFGANKGNAAGSFTVTFNAAGIFTAPR